MPWAIWSETLELVSLFHLVVGLSDSLRIEPTNLKPKAPKKTFDPFECLRWASKVTCGTWGSTLKPGSGRLTWADMHESFHWTFDLRFMQAWRTPKTSWLSQLDSQGEEVSVCPLSRNKSFKVLRPWAFMDPKKELLRNAPWKWWQHLQSVTTESDTLLQLEVSELQKKLIKYSGFCFAVYKCGCCCQFLCSITLQNLSLNISVEFCNSLFLRISNIFW